MSFLWFLFACLTVVGSLTYNVNVKMGTTHTNVFAFVFVMSACLFCLQIVIFLITKYGFKVDMSTALSSQTFKYAGTAALGVAVIDIFYFLAIRYGTPIQSQMFWTIGGMIALAAFSFLFFKEPMPPVKLIGIILGIISLVLVIRS